DAALCLTRGTGAGRRRLPEAAGAREVPSVIAAAEIAVGYGASRVRCVHEVAVTGVDADVVHVFRANAEEHEIARRQPRERHRAGGAQLLRRCARDGEPDLLVHKEREPAAIEA